MEENTVMTEEMENTTPETTYDESYEDSGSGLGGVLLGSALTIGAFAIIKGGKWLWKKIRKPKKDDSKEKSESSESEETETFETEKKK